MRHLIYPEGYFKRRRELTIGKGGFDETQHPRADDGKFTNGGPTSMWEKPKEKLGGMKPGERYPLPTLYTSSGAQHGLSVSLDRVNASGSRTYLLHATDGGIMQRISEKDLLRFMKPK